MNQDKASFEAANLLSENGMIKDDDFDYVFQILGQLYAIGYDEGRLQYRKRRQVVQYTMQGQQVAVHDSAVIAARAVDRTKHSISMAALGKTNSSAGFKWEYLDELKEINI